MIEVNKIQLKKVQGFVRYDMPQKGETILTDFPEIKDDMEYLDFIKSIDIYFRSPEECPFARGNWICDITHSYPQEDFVIYFKYPKEMGEERMLEYWAPLIKLLKFKSDRKMH